MQSLKELYRIGKGPSSSHTIGPERACKLFLSEYPTADEFRVTLYGSLAKTGDGHGTEDIVRAILKNVTIELNESETLLKGDVKFRRENVGLFMPDGKLKRNIVFTSPSAAAKFVCGFPVAGPSFWKSENGIKLKDARNA